MSAPSYVYVASSWRNGQQPAVVESLRARGFGVYDFRNPEGATGFAWSQVGLPHGTVADRRDYLAALEHERAVRGFTSDFDAMQAADTFVLVLPCGRSAHLELGWAVGAGKRTVILLDDPCTPELMYRMVDHLAADLTEVMDFLGDPAQVPEPDLQRALELYRAHVGIEPRRAVSAYAAADAGIKLHDHLDGEHRWCRTCGCTDDYACDEGCSWVAPGLCSACDPALADTAPLVAAPPAVSPDCRVGKCRACSGDGGYDDQRDTVVECAHGCHATARA